MRRRLAAAIVGVTAGALLLFGLPLALAVTRIYQDEELIRVQRSAAAATDVIGPRIGAADPTELPSSGSERLGLYDRAGRLSAGRGPAKADVAVRLALRGRVGQSTSGGRLVVAVPVARSERVIGVIRADRTNDAVHARARAAWRIMAGIAVAVLALVSAIAVLVARRMIRPVAALTVAVRKLGDGDFGTRASPSGVPELDEATAALNSTAGRLGDLVERERAFSANASHQLRTPLTAIRLDLEAGDAGRALAHVDWLQDTITTLLDAARDTRVAGERLPLAPLLTEVHTIWSGRLAAAGRPLRIVLPEDLPAVLATHGAVRQILQVLVENACEHGAGPVVVAARATSGAVAIDISDAGAGVAGDTEAIFQRRASAAQGGGIGLSLARSLAAADGGRLVLQREGPAPTFTLLLRSAAGSGPA